MARILIVDDDDLVRDALRLMLGREGHDVTEAANGREAIALHKNSPFPLIITDLIMPDMEGIETIVEMRKITPNSGIVAISGGARSSPEQLLTLAQKYGADATFSKPIDRKEFMESVSRLLLKA
jgi:CheY-like chemotaxis protein